MTEVWISFYLGPDNEIENDYLACWDTPGQARQDLFRRIVPLMEQRLRDLKRGSIIIDEEYYFNKRLKIRKAFRECEEDLAELAEVLWKDEEKQLEWEIVPAKQ